MESWKKLDLRLPRRMAKHEEDFFLDKLMPTTDQKRLTVWTDGSAKGDRAAWAVVDPEMGYQLSDRVWGSQTSYCGELCAIYAALCMALAAVNLIVC